MVGYLRAREWVKTHLEINVHAMNAVLGSPTGRLQIFRANWKLITEYPWIIENCQGHKLELIETPVQ